MKVREAFAHDSLLATSGISSILITLDCLFQLKKFYLNTHIVENIDIAYEFIDRDKSKVLGKIIRHIN
jgi:hypothetical protein